MQFIQDLINQVIPYILRIFGAGSIFLLGQKLADLVSVFARNFVERKGFSKKGTNTVYKIVYYFLTGITILMTLDNLLNNNVTSLLSILAFVFVAMTYGYGREHLDALKFHVMNLFTSYSLAQGDMVYASAYKIIDRLDLFNVGDFVEVADGVQGVVSAIRDYYTVLETADKKTIILPHTLIVHDKIINFTQDGLRAINFSFGIGYDDDLLKAKHLLQEIVAAEPLISPNPAPIVGVQELADSSVNFLVRVYVEVKNYGKVHRAIIEQVKLKFDEAGISIPYPQQEIHLHQVAK